MRILIVALIRHYERIVPQNIYRNIVILAEVVFLRLEDNHHRILQNRNEVYVHLFPRITHQSYIQRPVNKSSYHLLMPELLYLEHHLRIIVVEVLYNLRHPVNRCADECADPDRSPVQSLYLSHLLIKPLFASYELPHGRYQHLCLIGWLDSPVGLDQQRKTDFILKSLHCLCQIRLGISESLTCFGQASFVYCGK